MGVTFKEDVEYFLSLPEANFGFETLRGQQLLSKVPFDDDEVYRYFARFVLPIKENDNDGVGSDDITITLEEQAARSYRAMKILRQDVSREMGPSVLIIGPTQAGLLVKDLLQGLSVVAADDARRYSTYHIRELLDALLEAYPEKAMSATATGGKQGVEEHLGPLLHSDQTLSVLTHLVCIGATGRKGIASAEKSAQHTAMYHHMHNDERNKISLGQRRKFVKAVSDFALIDHLADGLTSKSAGEELCEAILTIVEVIGYPPESLPVPGQQPDKDKKDEMVGEDILLAPLGRSDWWQRLFETIQRGDCTYEQREAISRACHHVFALATGNSSRICKSHAPATDATEQMSEKLVEEKEEKVVNRLVEWGLTDKIHAALRTQLPLLIKILDLPAQNILTYQGTYPANRGQEEDDSPGTTVLSIRHPGRYRTQPFGSWRVQLLSLLKEVLTYRGKAKATDVSKGDTPACVLAMDALMELPFPPEVLNSKKTKDNDGVAQVEEAIKIVYNPWPALCSLVWAYENNDFYHIIFFQMLQSVVLEHHEPSLRLILQKSKFLSRAVGSLKGPLRGVLMNCLNLMYLRSMSLPPSAFLHQYLGSHDGWKENREKLTDLTLNQQMSIKGEDGVVLDLNLGSPFAAKLGLSDIDEWDATTATTLSESSIDDSSPDAVPEGGNKKKKKIKKKKKK